MHCGRGGDRRGLVPRWLKGSWICQTIPYRGDEVHAVRAAAAKVEDLGLYPGRASSCPCFSGTSKPGTKPSSSEVMGQPRYLRGGHGEGTDPITDPWGMESFSKQLFSLALGGPQDINRESFILTSRSPRV